MMNAVKKRTIIAIEAFLLNAGYTGVERYIENLVRTILKDAGGIEYRIFLWGSCGKQFISDDTHAIIRFPFRSRIVRVVFQHLFFPIFIADCEWTLFTGYIGSFLYPGKKTVLCVYDLIALHQPHLVKKETANNYRIFLPHFLKSAQTVICPGNKVRDDISVFRKKGAILVSRLPIDDSFYEEYDSSLPPDIKLPHDYFFLVGYNEPKKNFGLLQSLTRRFPDQLFVVAGHGTSQLTIDNPAENIMALDFIDQTLLIHLYKNCNALLFPSIAEGYGFPVAEALSLNKPVICCRMAPLTEFEHPLLFFAENATAESMADAMGKFLQMETPERSASLMLDRWDTYWKRLKTGIQCEILLANQVKKKRLPYKQNGLSIVQ